MRVPGIPEEVERVESFGELRTGMIVWLVSCEACPSPRNHCGILVGEVYGEVFDAQNNLEGPQSHWTMAPVAACGVDCFTDEDVKLGDIYRVVDVTMDAERDTVARVRKLSVVE